MVYLLVKDDMTPVGIALSETEARDMADDGDFYVIPVRQGRLYPTLLDIGMVGTVTFNNTSLKTLVKQAKSRLDSIDGQISNIQSQGQNLNSAMQDLADRVTALENP